MPAFLSAVRCGTLTAVLVVVGCERPSRADAVHSAPVAGPARDVAWAEPAWPDEATSGAVVYVPVYSQIYHGDATREIDLAATLSVRNTDPQHAVSVASVAYYDSDGHLVREHLDGPVRLGPLGTRSFVVEDGDRAGGAGANFLVTWSAAQAVSAPLIETVMISTANAQGLSFVGEGRVVRTLGPAAADGD